MKFNTLTVAVILLSSSTLVDSVRIRRVKVKEWNTYEEYATQAVIEGGIDRPFEGGYGSGAAGADAETADAPVIALRSAASLVQEAASQGIEQLDILSNEPLSKKLKVSRSTFSKTLEHVRSANRHSRVAILDAACDSFAFSCDEIIQLATTSDEAIIFSDGRANEGCISDPANARSIRDAIEIRYHADYRARGLWQHLDEAFINNERLKPARDVAPPPVRLQMRLRSNTDMQKLLRDMKKLPLIQAFWQAGNRTSYEPGSPMVHEFKTWLKQVRANGEQFSGAQLVSLVEAIPKTPAFVPKQISAISEMKLWNAQLAKFVAGMPYTSVAGYTTSGTSQAVSVLLQHLEQYVTGITCEEVKHIMTWSGENPLWWGFPLGFNALKSNIVDGQNKVDIVAFSDSLNLFLVEQVDKALRHVGVGLPDKNNPIFGVVKGNPVILIVDESRSMDASFDLGQETFTSRKFCNSQLQTVLEGLQDGTLFNVIQYSSSAVKCFQRAVPVSKTNIDRAMEAMGTTWRTEYARGDDPVQMLQSIRLFTRKFQSTRRNALEALQLAYATADEHSQQSEHWQQALNDPSKLDFPEHSPQIYFLTSGQPDGDASQILGNIDELNKGRTIPVNTIAFIKSADFLAKKFAKDLARKTGGFFRSIEYPSQPTNKRKQASIGSIKR